MPWFLLIERAERVCRFIQELDKRKDPLPDSGRPMGTIEIGIEWYIVTVVYPGPDGIERTSDLLFSRRIEKIVRIFGGRR